MRVLLGLALVAACSSHHGGGLGDDDDGSGHGLTDGGSDGSGSDGSGGSGGSGSDGSGSDGSGSGSGTGNAVQTCDANHWLPPIAVAGPGIMRFAAKTYVFSQAGTSWAVVDHATGVATTSAIPLPSGVTAMQLVKAEIGLDGKPVIWFFNANHDYATRWDGTAFSPAIDLASSQVVHADAAGNLYAYGANGLTEYAPNGTSLVRGTFPVSTTLPWNVAADGTVYLLKQVNRPSTIHQGDTANDLRAVHLPHGSLTWSADQQIASNEGYGWSGTAFGTAPDGSLHIAWMLGGVNYWRSHDGVTWAQSRASDYASTATMIDAAPGNEQIDPPDRPQDVTGYPHLVAARDYDHVAITLDFPTSSLYTSSYYQLRRCAPFSGTNMTWPAERFSFSEAWTGEAAVDEHGVASIMTPLGLRVDVVQ